VDIVGVSIFLTVTCSASLASGWWCINNLKKARYLLDTPTSKVRSAAQGYVELYGVLKEGEQLLSAPLTGEPCVWWSFAIDEQVRSGKNNKRWQQVEGAKSIALLCLNDGTGDCLIDPQGAHVLPMTKQVWYGSSRHPRQELPRRNILQVMLSGLKNYRYTEQRLHVNEPLYAIGDFVTRGGGQEAFDMTATQGAVIREWKSDYAGLLRRFDRDRNGELDQSEWLKVREAAEVAAQQLHRQRSAAPAQHFLGKPQESQPFILSSHGEDDIAKRFVWQAIFAACICIASGLGAAYIINTQF
jgi:hypothetical protein